VSDYQCPFLSDFRVKMVFEGCFSRARACAIAHNAHARVYILSIYYSIYIDRGCGGKMKKGDTSSVVPPSGLFVVEHPSFSCDQPSCIHSIVQNHGL
jgi:hypothetical protein